MQCTCTLWLKKVLCAGLLSSGIFLYSQPVSAQQKADQQRVENILQQQSQSWNRGDLNGFMQTYWQNDSLCFVGKDGLTYGWKAALQRYQRSYPDAKAMGKLTFQLQQIKFLSPAYCFVIGHWHLTRDAGNLEGEFTLLLRKINGHWKIIVDHSS